THWIGGKPWTGEAERRGDIYNPATGHISGTVDFASTQDVDEAVKTAKEAAKTWGKVSLSKRATVLFAFRELVKNHATELAKLITDEHGKVASDAAGEVARGLEVVEFACGIPHLLKGAVDAILEHPDIAAVSFVGSTPIARYVYESGTQNGKRVQALGGAKNHMIVLPDADLDLAGDAAVSAGFGSAGERCMAISALVAVDPVG